MTHLKATWKSELIELICGTDRGLKDEIDTDRYVIYRKYGENPILQEHAADSQLQCHTSSTRQELLAQMSIDYLIAH